MKSPGMEVYLNWIVEAWKALPEDLIAKSFKSCGITNSIDGSEDNALHCFNIYGPIPSGFDSLKKARAEMNSNFDIVLDLPEEVDLVQDEENGYATDASIEIDPIEIET